MLQKRVCLNIPISNISPEAYAKVNKFMLTYYKHVDLDKYSVTRLTNILKIIVEDSLETIYLKYG